VLVVRDRFAAEPLLERRDLGACRAAANAKLTSSLSVRPL
jgi:hypothetical protein